jgi:hypothetical protein
MYSRMQTLLASCGVDVIRCGAAGDDRLWLQPQVTDLHHVQELRSSDVLGLPGVAALQLQSCGQSDPCGLHHRLSHAAAPQLTPQTLVASAIPLTSRRPIHRLRIGLPCGDHF